jgi:L,D-peptidoglycan transpeptidase YkuD (ErfK/YbiS/YcfS/YnhG family)
LRRKRKESAASASGIGLITLFSTPRDRRRGVLRAGPLVLPCALGRTGVTHRKREGDGATPAGRYRLLSLFYRHDRGPPPPTCLPLRTLRRHDGWCEDPRDGRYNRPLRLPASAGHERMWRADHLYDVVGILDWNMRPRIAGRGSAIFLHLARPGLAPTAGCIALEKAHLRRLLGALGRRPVFVVEDKPRKARAAAGRPLRNRRRAA